MGILVRGETRREDYLIDTRALERSEAEPEVAGDLAEWDERFAAWKRSHAFLSLPVTPDDECEIVRPSFSNTTTADIKRMYQRSDDRKGLLDRMNPRLFTYEAR